MDDDNDIRSYKRVGMDETLVLFSAVCGPKFTKVTAYTGKITKFLCFWAANLFWWASPNFINSVTVEHVKSFKIWWWSTLRPRRLGASVCQHWWVVRRAEWRTQEGRRQVELIAAIRRLTTFPTAVTHVSFDLLSGHEVRLFSVRQNGSLDCRTSVVQVLGCS